ncbi:MULTISPECIES: FtsK/SpoIIIE domain-containing protein [Catenuloplanes]|uniref:S-DNA-T family DNA segregation ATPase FtsK/SpoIIIE n=1 Tax=Catenuloplanes niger TaxID=587534 RepID=A0AAE3ZQN0_9ACTN|nr:FtsK/SpoIIIE domain-containing protein [Catenuloplanes niger]MDR7322448.1 S-DNA-T family DNA segregation ATPase FtsK/SpoIIIE [Catenuloplanes niger]
MRRAYSRRWRRSHSDPIVVFPDRSPLFALALVALSKALFRYRSELAPVAVMVALYVTALVLHHRDPGAWPWIPASTVATATLTLWHPRYRSEEKACAFAAVMAAGAWLTAATAYGPGTAPLPTLLLVTTAVGAVPWWMHRRRRARVRVDRTIRAWPGMSERVGLAGSKIQSAVVDAWGWRASMVLRPGQTVADAVAQVPAIESGLGTRPGAVRVEADPAHAGRFVMRVLAADPHATAIPWPGPQSTSVADPIDIGVFEDAEHVRISVLRRHVLIGGTTDSGKSGVLNGLLGNLAACRDVVLWGIDLKGGMELRPWASCLDRLATTPAEAAALLDDANRILDARAHALGRDASRVWKPSAQRPALIVVIDEYAELTDTAPEAVDSAESIARRGRALAVTLLVATQRPTQKAMGGGALRSQMSTRICLRVRERRDVDLVLDRGMLAAGWHAHTLDAPGKFYVLADGHTRPRRARAYLVTDNDVRRTAAHHANSRPSLDAPSTNATDDVLEGTVITPEETLWRALDTAPATGRSVPDLIQLTGMKRTWIYDRLHAWARTGRAVQASRGRWRANRD